jgi:hypothetical protein
MDQCESQNNSDGYVEERMGKMWKEGNKLDSTLSWRLNIVECIRWRHYKKMLG